MVTLLHPTDRIIEVGPPDTSTGAELLAQGCERYLGLVPEGSYGRFVSRAGRLTDHYRPLPSAMSGVRNNADILILHDRFARLLWEEQLGDARLIAVRASGPAAAEARFAARLHRRHAVARVRWGTHRYWVVGRDPKPRTSARHYAVDPVRLLDRLEDEQLRYVVLRWFEALPQVEAGEDLDLLVADEDLPRVREVLSESPGTFPVDLYSVSGLPGTDFRSVAYYPPALATGMLERSVRHRSGYRVPNPRDHFLSLAYHALYHKGGDSGLPTTLLDGGREAPQDHDYRAHLRRLSEQTGFDGPLTMEALDEHLEEAGWRPPRDTLARLAPGNPWMRRRFFPNSAPVPPPPLLAVFVLREVASADADVDRLRALAEEHGFEVVLTHRLSSVERQSCTAHMRGGNWGPGPFPASGGGPAVVIAVLDEHPLPPTEAQRRRFPGLDNARTVVVKEAFRAEFQSALDPDARCNPIHASDGQEDAWHYLELAAPDAEGWLRETVAVRRRVDAGTSPSTASSRRPVQLLGAVRTLPARSRALTRRAVKSARRLLRAAARRLVRQRVRAAYR
jgi:hypothetical protein